MLISKRMVARLVNRHNEIRIVSIRYIRILFYVSLLLLTSCESRDSSEYIFDNYLYRLSNSLAVSVKEESPLLVLPSYPDRRDLEQKIPSLKIDLLAFLRLSQCDLQRQIGQKNSSLGKFMAATQQLAYDVEFIRLANECLPKLGRHTALYQTLAQAIQHKTYYLPFTLWNASFASKEFSYLFSLGVKPLSMHQLKGDSLQLNNAIREILSGYQHIITGDEMLANTFVEKIESRYQIVQSTKRVGEIRKSMQSVIHYIDLADGLLNQRIKYQPLCVNALSAKKFAVVKTVFHKYYIGQIQPYLAKLHQQSKTLFELLDALVVLQSPPPVFNQFWGAVYKNNNSEWAIFDNAIKQHTQSWQALLRQCGALPK
jgi:hypothetical protein